MAHVILTLDASPGVRQMVSFTLTGAGYDVIEAERYKDALDIISGNKIDLVLADLNLPNENASEFIKKIQEHPQHKFIPIIVLTTESHTTQKQRLLYSGTVDWIEKPLKPDRLVSIIKKYLNNSR
ncbi:response regulator [candidate division KSB1 bacterium]|nr:response regulator [candidate division KSB1 bacterium]